MTPTRARLLRLEAFLLLGKLANESRDTRTANPTRYARLQPTLMRARRRFARRAAAATRDRRARRGRRGYDQARRRRALRYSWPANWYRRRGYRCDICLRAAVGRVRGEHFCGSCVAGVRRTARHLYPPVGREVALAASAVAAVPAPAPEARGYSWGAGWSLRPVRWRRSARRMRNGGYSPVASTYHHRPQRPYRGNYLDTRWRRARQAWFDRLIERMGA